MCPFLGKYIPSVEFRKSPQNPLFVLTSLGLECFREAIQKAERQTKEGKLYLGNNLTQRTDLDSQTISDLLQGDIQSARHQLK